MRTQTFGLLIVTIFMTRCVTKQEIKDEIYYVIKHPKPNTQDFGNNPLPPPLPTTFYGNYNFILLDTSKVFYHQVYQNYTCGTGIDFTKPTKLFLTPDSLKEVKINQLPEFLNGVITDSIARTRHFFASISYPVDTIRNRAFKLITDFFKTKNIRQYNIRNWTEEEQYVTTAKVENRKYNPDSINWKVGFAPPQTGIVQ
jgi:hypothetical protein